MGDTVQDVEQLSCPLEGFRTTAETQEGAAVRLIEHYVEEHPGGLPPEIAVPLDTVIDELKAKYR